MAIQQVYSVYDKAVGAFLRPFFLTSRGEALRSFMDACADDQVPFKKHPEDYILFQIGEFDDSVGKFTVVEPDKVITALEVVKKG